MTASRRVPATAASAVLVFLLSLGAMRVYAAGENAEGDRFARIVADVYVDHASRGMRALRSLKRSATVATTPVQSPNSR